MELTTMSKEELDTEFARTQQQITELQALQTQIANERRRRRFEVELEAKRAELAALEEKLSATR